MEVSQESFWSTLNSPVQWITNLEYLRIIWGGRDYKALSKFGFPTTCIKINQNTCDLQALTSLRHPNLWGVASALAKFLGGCDAAIFENHSLRKLDCDLYFPMRHSRSLYNSGGQPWLHTIIL